MGNSRNHEGDVSNLLLLLLLPLLQREVVASSCFPYFFFSISILYFQLQPLQTKVYSKTCRGKRVPLRLRRYDSSDEDDPCDAVDIAGHNIGSSYYDTIGKFMDNKQKLILNLYIVRTKYVLGEKVWERGDMTKKGQCIFIQNLNMISLHLKYLHSQLH